MIDLTQTRAEMLATIKALDSSGGPVFAITDPEVVTSNGRVRLRSCAREDLFALLKVTLAERFSDEPRSVLIRDLFMPLRHALGNAYRRGNRGDPAKEIAVEVVLAPMGALLAITDEGDGFDVGLAVERMQREETYFENKGVGFRGLHNAKSSVTWENDGRTLLLCFRRSADGSGVPFGEVRSGSAGELRRDDPSLRRLLDPAWIQTCLSRELPVFRDGLAKLESCHCYLNRGPGGDDCGIRYMLKVTTAHARPVHTTSHRTA